MIETRDTADTALRRERKLVETFVELTDTLVEDFDVVDFFSALTERVVQLGLATEAGILLVDEAGDLQFTAASDERTHLLELFVVQNEQGPAAAGVADTHRHRAGQGHHPRAARHCNGRSLREAAQLRTEEQAELHDVALAVVRGVLAATDLD